MNTLINANDTKYTFSIFKLDFVASIVVFLVAIPLCLGIALASGAPLFSGIIAGIIGGIVVGIISPSQISISGPAAGMAAVVLATITDLGGFQPFLAALVIAGCIQLLIGILRAGFIGEYVPSNVVQGLLCAIGILLIVKQIPFAFSLTSTMNDYKEALLEGSKSIHFKTITDIFYHLNYGAIFISSLSFAVIILWDKMKSPFFLTIPSPIVVVILGIILNEVFLTINSPLAQIHEDTLVNIPVHNTFFDFISQLTFPSFQDFYQSKIYFYGLIMAIVASLETLLNIKASEKIDPLKRHASKNRELVAQGIGNTLSGLIGGLPITSVILRTSVNIQSGGRTKVSVILHGLFIMIAVIFLPKIMNAIPLASLAVILIMTGYKLTKPHIYKQIYAQGMDRFLPFIITVIGIISIDMLSGILLGLIISLFFILKNNSQSRIDIIEEQHSAGIIYRIILPQQITFLNKASLFDELDAIPNGTKLIIDASHANFIDKEIIELIEEFKQEAPLRQIALNTIGFKEAYRMHNQIDFIHVTTIDIQANLTPKQVLTILEEGNKRFYNDKRIHRSTQMDIRFTSATQHPIAVILACIDSRVPVETVFDMSFGDLFCIRIAGNVINNDILASMEYACHVVGARLIVVMGHTRCGAIDAACQQVDVGGHVTTLLSKIKPAVQACSIDKEDAISEKISDDQKKRVTEMNIANTMQDIYEGSSILQNLIKTGKINCVGGLYDVSTGRVNFKNYATDMSTLEKGIVVSADYQSRISELFEARE